MARGRGPGWDPAAARRPRLELRTLQALGSRRPPPCSSLPDTNGHWSKLRPARVPGEPCGGVSQAAGQRLRRSRSSWKWGGACLSSWGPSGARRLFLGWPVLPGQLWPGCLRPGASQGCRHVPGRFPGVVCDGSGPPRARGPGWQGSHPAQVGGVWVGRGDASPAETVGLCDAPICSTEKAQPSLHRLYCWRSSQVGGVLEPRCPSPRPLPAAQAAPLGPPLGCFDSVLIFCFF